MSDEATLPDPAGGLRRRVEELEAELARAQGVIEILRGLLSKLNRALFGRRAEGIDPNQLELLLQDGTQLLVPATDADSDSADPEEPAAEPELKAPPKRDRRRGESAIRIPENLEVIETVLDPPEVKRDPKRWRLIGQEITETLDLIQSRFVKRRLIRNKFVPVDDDQGAPVVAPAPKRLIDGGRVEAGLLAQIAAGKYLDHLPLYRQEQIFWNRHGVWIPRQRMCEWIGQLAHGLGLVYQAHRQEVLRDSYLQGDETRVRYLRGSKPGSQLGFMWTYRALDGSVVYDWHPGRSAEALIAFLGENWQGCFQCDGYGVYECKRVEAELDLTTFGCWAHVRRKFFDALVQAPQQAAWILRHIQAMYQWESQLRNSRTVPAERARVRASHHRMVLDRLLVVLEKLRPRFTPKSLMGQALRYALNQWERLVRFVDYGLVEIDNNWVENAIRPLALGRRNWLFFGSPEGGRRAAIICSLLISCKNLGIEPLGYLRAVIERLPEMTNQNIHELTPRNWLRQHGRTLPETPGNQRPCRDG